MPIRNTRGASALAIIACLGLVACGLPRSGPTKAEIFEGSVQRQGDAFVVSVNDRVTRATAVIPSFGFPPGFLNAGVLGSDTIRPGDTLALTIYENVEEGLLAGEGVNASTLTDVQVDGSGFIFVPYAGRIRAAGNTPEALRRIITTRLDEQTPDPQVVVSRVAGDGATVSVVGAINGQGVYPIERPTRTLKNMIAAAGGVSVEPEIVRVTITRGDMQAEVWLQDLYENPALDIALRDGDDILVEADTRDFTALGATGAQALVPFETRTISAIEAIASVGGLNPGSADPTGVFVFRNEPEVIAEAVLARSDLIGVQRMVYVLDLTRPLGMFNARDFLIRDGDTVYVTEAPYSQFAKVLTAITQTTGTATGLASTF